MIKSFRIAGVLMLALLASLSVTSASAQMQHFTLNVVIETADGGTIPGGQVCVSGEVEPICQDIPAGTPSGREFAFADLADGDHEITIGGADPYLDIIDNVTISEIDTTVTEVLQLEQVVPTPVPDLPNTGVGSSAAAGSSSTTVLLLAASGALGLLSLSVMQLRRRR